MGTILQKIWPYVRPHVVSFLLIATVIFLGWRLLKKERSQFESDKASYVDKMNAMRNDHDEVIKKMQSSLDLERKQHDEAIARWKLSLAEAQKKYEKDLEEILKKKNDQTKKLIAVYGDDPEGMASQVSAATGFKIVVPEQVK